MSGATTLDDVELSDPWVAALGSQDYATNAERVHRGLLPAPVDDPLP
jgi:hypothetical protein